MFLGRRGVASLASVVAMVGCAPAPADETAPLVDGGATGDLGADAALDVAAAPVCRDLPQDAKLDTSLPGCRPKAGTWTKYNVTLGARPTYVMTCGKTNPPYHDQSSFDSGEASAASPGITVESNHDYFRGATCASGSIELRAKGATSTLLVVWKLEPK